MSGFSAEWLALREPADHAARAPEAAAFVAAFLDGRAPVSVVDLGAGTGSNGRYLSPFLPAPQRWRLVDHDRGLLAEAQRRLSFAIEPQVCDLHTLDPGLVAGADLVTASALLDLVSESWLVQLVDDCARGRAAVLFALNYDGRIACTPRDDDDELVRTLVNEHQRTDKGFGPALGPLASARAAALIASANYEVGVFQSDWVLGPAHAPLQRELVTGWAAAASEIGPSSAGRIEAWRRRRIAHIGAGRSTIEVGHEDVAGRPRGGVR